MWNKGIGQSIVLTISFYSNMLYILWPCQILTLTFQYSACFTINLLILRFQHKQVQVCFEHRYSLVFLKKHLDVKGGSPGMTTEMLFIAIKGLLQPPGTLLRHSWPKCSSIKCLWQGDFKGRNHVLVSFLAAVGEGFLAVQQKLRWFSWGVLTLES